MASPINFQNENEELDSSRPMIPSGPKGKETTLSSSVDRRFKLKGALKNSTAMNLESSPEVIKTENYIPDLALSKGKSTVENSAARSVRK